MKILIWGLAILVVVILNELLGRIVGFKAGYIIVYLLIGVLARNLCKKWDERK